MFINVTPTFPTRKKIIQINMIMQTFIYNRESTQERYESGSTSSG